MLLIKKSTGMNQKSPNIETISYTDLETSSYFRGLDWDKLKHFYYVAKVGNISHAAQLFNTTQSSFSRYISALEKYLGYPLFFRDRDGVTLTHRGRELYQIVERIFFSIKGYTSRTAKPLQTGQRRKIRIATNHALASYVINSIILEYNKDHPDLVFEILEINQLIDVIFHDIDIAIQPAIPKESDELWQVIQEPFFSQKMNLYASDRYLNEYGMPQSVEDLKHHRLIVPTTFGGYFVQGGRRILEIIKQSNGIKPQLVFLSNSLECLVEAAQQNKGIVCLYDQLTIVKESNLKQILPDFVIHDCQQYFIYPKYLKDDQVIMNIKNYIKNNIRGKEIYKNPDS